MRRTRLPASRAAIVPLALACGVATGGWLTDQDVGNPITAIVFTAIGTSFAALQMVSVERHRRATRAERTAVAARLPFPPMLVQPLVENAVTHGIEPLREGGLVRVDARRGCHDLVITVEDSGIGLGQSVRHGAGTGVRTVRDRLEALFGCCASLELARRTPQGTRAEIKIRSPCSTGDGHDAGWRIVSDRRG